MLPDCWESSSSVTGGKLMSINHESKPPYGEGLAHLNVSEAVERLGGFELEHRFPYWLRKGYVLEIYSVGA
jgi:hypothetical protein